MSSDRLTALQRRILQTLGSLASPGVVTGGAVLATLEVHVLQRSPALVRLAVGDRRDTCMGDLVAEPVNAIEPPVVVTVEGVCVLVDSRHEMLVNKLCTLLELIAHPGPALVEPPSRS